MKLLDAVAHHQAGRLAEAAQIYTEILQADPDHADALHLMGKVAGELGDADAAIALISRASTLCPTNPAYLMSLGAAYRSKQLFDPALRCYADALAIEPDSASAYFGLGNTQQGMGDIGAAARSFGRAIELNPGFFEACYNLANIEKALGQYAQAIDHYRRAVALNPDFADAHHNLGSALHASGRVDEALASYEHALEAKLPETYNNIGNIHFDQGHPERAISFYRQALAAKPDYPEACNNLGAALRKLGRRDESAEAFLAAIRLMPEYADAHVNLGDLLIEGDRVDEAAGHYEQAIAAAPGMATAHFKLGVARSRQDDRQSACRCFEQAVAASPDYLDALYNLGVIQAQLQQAAEAERCYRQVLELDPGYVNARINLSALLMDDGRRSEAKSHIDLAYAQKNLFERYSAGARRTVLLLLDAGKGNLNFTHLFDDRTNNIIDWMIEYAPDGQAASLPDYDLVFNAMADPDATGDTSGPVGRFLERCTKPLLNHPDKVARTARHKLPALLEGIDGLLLPNVWRYASRADWDEAILEQLPLLIRPVYSHGGVGMVLAESSSELERYREQQSDAVYVSRFIDYRSADSWFRKYRMIFIDRQPLPYHLAISQSWMVHYYSAEMASATWKLEEEQVFLQDPQAVLGAAGMEAIRAVGARMDLDYAGIDFSIMPDGRILVFEANPAMLVHPENSPGPLAHKNIHVRRILDAFEAMLDRSCHPST